MGLSTGAAIRLSTTIPATATMAGRRSFSRASSSAVGITRVRGRTTVQGRTVTGMTGPAGAGRRRAVGTTVRRRGIAAEAAHRRNKRAVVADTRTDRRRKPAAAVRRRPHLRRLAALRRCRRRWAVNRPDPIAPRRHRRTAAEIARAAIHAAFSDATADRPREPRHRAGCLKSKNRPRRIEQSGAALLYPRCECCALYNSRNVRPTGAGMSRVPVHPAPKGSREIAFLFPPMRSSTRTASFVKSAYASGRFAK